MAAARRADAVEACAAALDAQVAQMAEQQSALLAIAAKASTQDKPEAE